MEFDIGENGRARHEAHGRAAQGRWSDYLERIDRLAEAIFLLMLEPIAVNRQIQHFRQGVDHGYADTVQAAGNLVRVVVELAASVQHGHDHFGSRTPFFVHVDRNATAIIDHTDRGIAVDGHDHTIAISCQSLIDGVVHHLEHHVVQAGTVIGIADVHARALAHRFQAFEYLDVARIVMVVLIVLLSHAQQASGVATVGSRHGTSARPVKTAIIAAARSGRLRLEHAATELSPRRVPRGTSAHHLCYSMVPTPQAFRCR